MNDAPKPEIMIKLKKFQINANNKKYDISLKLTTNNLIIIINNYEEIPPIEFLDSFALSDLFKICNWFKMFESINEVYDEIEKLFENKKVTLNLQEDLINLIFEIDMVKIKSFNILIKKSDSSNEDIIKMLCENLKKCQEENLILKNRINDLEKRIKIIEDKFEKQTKIEKEEIFNKEKNEFLTSDILNDDDKKLLIEWFNPYNNKSIKLLYKASRDGDGYQDFYNKCENKGPTITIVLTTSGNKFGGYTSLSWQKPMAKAFYIDNDSFLFSLNKKKKYFKKSNEDIHAICMWHDRGPSFGFGNDLTLNNKCLHNNNSSVCPYTYQIEKYELNGGENSFTVKDYEVYSIS
jgi:hypothetical protein